MTDMPKTKIALLSVFDKARIVELAQFLVGNCFRILATGNTSRILTEAGIDVTEVSEHTGYPEIMGGRVKTLHPKVFAGILSNREGHSSDASKLDIDEIDVVVVNLYPFQDAVALHGASDTDIIELIDIGGASLLRAGAKNFQHVTVISDIDDYDGLMSEVVKNSGSTTLEYRRRMALKAFAKTSAHDACVHSWMSKREDDLFPPTMVLPAQKIQDLRIGENPHQKAAIYSISGAELPLVQLYGKELSFNNIVDIEAAVKIVLEFSTPAVSVIKHGNPCGAAISTISVADAYERAINCDFKSSFGGVIALNSALTVDIANKIVNIFIEAVAAPSFDEDALTILKTKKNVRIMQYKAWAESQLVFKSVFGNGLLAQERDSSAVGLSNFLKVTTQEATAQSLSDLLFAWKVCKHVKSNAIVVALEGRAIGVGAGQMSRVDSVEIAIRKASDCSGAVLASDAFFPFPDSIQYASSAGICAIVQPGGSVRDKEVIEAANNAGIAMYFTNFRSFYH